MLQSHADYLAKTEGNPALWRLVCHLRQMCPAQTACGAHLERVAD